MPLTLADTCVYTIQNPEELAEAAASGRALREGKRWVAARSLLASARSGGVLRWSGKHFDRSLAGSAWVAMDAAVPTFAGEILHSPAPSSIHVRLPGGGWLEAGPSSWLAVGAESEFALLEGALTATADPSRSLVVEVPGAVVTATGEVEVSARTPSGAKSAEASSSATTAAPTSARRCRRKRVQTRPNWLCGAAVVALIAAAPAGRWPRWPGRRAGCR